MATPSEWVVGHGFVSGRLDMRHVAWLRGIPFVRRIRTMRRGRESETRPVAGPRTPRARNHTEPRRGTDEKAAARETQELHAPDRGARIADRPERERRG